jgi:nicotinate-nucleotide pyrophosphorylase (carboxylating)
MKPTLPDNIAQMVANALAEDVGKGDLTAQLVPPARTGSAQVISREPAVLCGQAWFDEVFRQCDAAINIRWMFADGQTVAPNQVLCQIEGPARALLTAERTALNFLQTLSGTATLVRRYADKVRGTHAKILDTRKTIPGLRSAQKYAVICGGGHNHRHGLYDGILIKENHIIAAGSIAAAVQSAFQLNSGVPVQVETESLSQVEEALQAGADMVLLDNFPIHQLNTAVRMRQRFRLPDGSYPLFEASGNIDLSNVRLVADAGVDRISIGGLTKNVNAIDLSMRFDL